VVDLYKFASYAAAGVLAAGLMTSGCATKKHVRNTIAPLEQRIGTLEKQGKQHETSIAELERGVSRADERAQGADKRAAEAGSTATRATEMAQRSGELAETANQAAGGAKSLAEQGLARSAAVERKVEALDKYELVLTESVLFGLNKSELNDEAKAKLDEAAAAAAKQTRYVLEVQGFTDRTGSQELNLELSRKRADAVVRYLTVTHKIPLHRIALVGLGSEAPVADNTTRTGRAQNRRVEVRIYKAGVEAASQQADARVNDSR